MEQPEVFLIVGFPPEQVVHDLRGLGVMSLHKNELRVLVIDEPLLPLEVSASEVLDPLLRGHELAEVPIHRFLLFSLSSEFLLLFFVKGLFGTQVVLGHVVRVF